MEMARNTVNLHPQRTIFGQTAGHAFMQDAGLFHPHRTAMQHVQRGITR